ncbi:hypothetical protein SAMN05216223_102151 [Actinacidiphila yanglinensis]|uniref:Integral membrane protein n=1 Tax=Actinacidiphila yanglinensis TaxID=310779 RepID=A0A1H5V4W1_9ACTN|nr:DUF6113 family protein [Actinacidiphila yanglinensis]SEF82339.1 hypothetical protein SAMN05216223_102151 [Actinacidiphila yanglinensis]
MPIVRPLFSNPRGTQGARIAGYLAFAVLAVAVAVAGSLVQAAWEPGGLLLALAGCVGLFYGGGKLTGTRLGTVVPGAVWLVGVIFLSGSRPEGDFLLAAGIGPYIYLLGGALSAVICATLPQLPPSGTNRT